MRGIVYFTVVATAVNLIASVAVNPPGPGCEMPDTLFAPRRNPVGGLVDGAYMVTNPRDPQRVRVRAELHL